MAERNELGLRAGDDFTIAGAEASYAPDLALEPTHIAIALRLDIEAERAEGSVRTRVRCNRSGSRTLVLDAVALDIGGVDGVAWRHDGTRLHLNWAEPFTSGEEREFTVRYAVQSPISGMLFRHPDDAYPDRPLLVATDHETERARYWLPCVDYPTVRTTFEFELTVREGLTVLAGGAHLGDESNGDGTITSRWRLDQPCPSYLCCLAAGEFSRADGREVDGVPHAYFAAQRFDPEMLERSFGRAPAMMEWLVRRLDHPFPYPKYFQIAVPEIGGAMENISLTTWDDVFVLDEPLHGELALRVDSVNLHEMAHSYFGDLIVCRHFEHTWLKESWAVYMETVYFEETLGRDEADYELYSNAEAYMTEVEERYARPIVTRVYNSSWDIFDNHTYPGGAWRIHMLRRIVGDDAFWAATRDYVKTFANRTVETDDFRRKLEEHSGLNLVRFFDQWVYGKGFPKLTVEYAHDAEKSTCTLKVKQAQKDDKKGIGLFDFDLEIEITDDDGPRSVTVPVREELNTIVTPVKGEPSMVRIDPERRVLFRQTFQPGDDLLKAALTGAGDVISRIHAARELIETGKRANLEAVREAMAKESFWGVRVAVAQWLAKSKRAEAIPVLAAMLAAEREPKVMRYLAKAAGAMRHASLRAALLDFLKSDPPPAAKAAALTALGQQRDPADFDLLVQAAGDGGIHHLVASGAIGGLGQSATMEAFEWLAGRLAYGELPEPNRPAAAQALGACASRLERNARARAGDALVDLTRDPNSRVRMAAAGALVGLRAPGAAAALASLKTLQPNQDAPEIQRWIDALAKGAPAEETRKLTERCEKLEEQIRKMDARIQDLEARD
jgi:aminopeptidase N